MAVVSEIHFPEAKVGCGDQPSLTVVVCTFKRPDSLGRFLQSLTQQDRQFSECLIVDASPDDQSEQVVRNVLTASPLRWNVRYFRVAGEERGLTRQRNFALQRVSSDLVAFFDDDVVLAPDCLSELVRVHVGRSDAVVAVGASTGNGAPVESTLWKLRRALRIVSNLKPGSYQRSGMSVPWEFLPPTTDAVEGDWLGGFAMMWKTSVIRDLQFREAFEGYAQGEDLDVSLRAHKFGKLLLAGGAHVQHLEDRSGRPDQFRLGYMAIHNRYQIHRHGLPDRTWRDVAWFAYAWLMDSILLARNCRKPQNIIPTMKQWLGRLRAAYDIVMGH